MNDEKTEKQKDGIELEYELNEPPQKVWRAISFQNFGTVGCRRRH